MAANERCPDESPLGATAKSGALVGDEASDTSEPTSAERDIR